MEPTADLVSHVVGHGRTRLRFVGDPDLSRDGARRYAGYLQTISESGLQEDDGPIRVQLDEAGGRTAARHVLEHPGRWDALICANDELALAAKLESEHHGVRCPDDLAITGWDDIMSARYTQPGLSTVRQPTEELGRVLSQRLHERIVMDVAPQPLVSLASQVVIRGSCGCPDDHAEGSD